MVRSPKSGRVLGAETADRAPWYLRLLLGHADVEDDES